jgi:hypothetical protein
LVSFYIGEGAILDWTPIATDSRRAIIFAIARDVFLRGLCSESPSNFENLAPGFSILAVIARRAWAGFLVPGEALRTRGQVVSY